MTLSIMSADKLDKAAAGILQRGVLMDSKKRYTEALVCYQEGLQLLIDSMKNMSDPVKKKKVHEKVEEYMERAENLKKYLKQTKMDGKYHEQIKIDNDSTGHSYQSVFGRFLDEDVEEVVVEDPYIRLFHQCQNFLRMCELLVKSCSNLKKIKLLTASDANQSANEQASFLGKIKESLLHHGVELIIDINPNLHDRQIVLSTGWVIKIGRGLDYFKPPDGKMSIGSCDMDLRPCHETVVDVFHHSNIRTS